MIREWHYTIRDTSVGKMTQAFQLAVFDQDFQEKLASRMEAAVVDELLIRTGLLVVGALFGVSVVFGGSSWLARRTPDPLAA